MNTQVKARSAHSLEALDAMSFVFLNLHVETEKPDEHLFVSLFN